MNTVKLKTYAPQARREFITAVSKQFNQLGIYSDKQISEVKQEGSVLLIEGKTFEPSVKTARERLVKKVQAMGYNQLVEQVAYTWFNRLCAIRYMEIHDYLGHGFRVLSHPDNPKGFEIIDHAQDAADELGLDRARIIELKLAGNKDEELYRELLLGQCHKLHEAMPFLFDALDDETELLLPDNLTRTDSILRGLVDSIPEEDWQQVEVIGWLYQFYISEKKDQVMGKVVKSEDIPAATQLFTPNWIVKYLVQNSVGRQWLQTYPDSAIKTQMEYYIEPAEQSDEVNQQLKAITPESIEPETIKVLDPACGSGHILIEAYNVLKAIYEERGFRSRDIPKMILENNLHGLDIDDRAAQLSGFALMMMARDDDKRIFTRKVRLNVLSLQESNHIDLPTLWKALNLSGSWQSGTSQGLFSDEEQDLSSLNADDSMDAGGRATQDAKADNRYQLLKRTLARFTQAKTFGSLIDVPSDDHEQLKELLSTLVELQESGDSMQKPAAKQLIEFVHQALVLSIRYDAVIANPPYMGSNYFCPDLKRFINANYTVAKQNLYSSFIISSLMKTKKNGVATLITMAGWLYLSTFKSIRKSILSEYEIESLRVLGNEVFGSSVGSIVNAATCKIFNRQPLNVNANVIDLYGEEKSIFNREQAVSMPDMVLPINITTKHIKTIVNNPPLEKISTVCQGMSTANDQKYIRYWFEVSQTKNSIFGGSKWFPINKGGLTRKWYGNNYFVVNWENSGQEIKSDEKAYVRNDERYLEKGITWGRVAGGTPSFRFYPKGFVFSDIGCSVFPKKNFFKVLAILNSSPSKRVFDFMSENYKIEVGHVKALPIVDIDLDDDEVKKLIEIYKNDWDSSTLSWDFKKLNFYSSAIDFSEKTTKLYAEKYLECQELEEKINNSISDAYGWENDAEGYDCSPTLTQFNLNGENDPVSRLFVFLLEYYIGCGLGRYSLDREGLVYARSGNEGFDQLVAEGAYKTFPADEDGIIPLTDQEWFKDDATNRFREFIQVVWGEEHLQANLDFVAESLCLNAIKPKKSESALETIRRYLSTQFYKDHLKTYKKRPIYWLFSSGKQKAFECLVYLHRYNEGTLSRMRTEYVTPLLGKYDAYAEQLEKQIETADSTSEENRFKKELDALIKKQVELREFDDKLKHYADMRISLDLDDGVKVNYGKFGDLLADVKAITGSAPEVN